MQIRDSDEYLPDEEDIYGVNEINEYDSDYWMPAEARARRRKLILRIVAGVVALAFVLGFVFWVSF